MGKKKYDFDFSLMGKLVVVTQVYERRYEKNVVYYTALNVEERRQGWVVGYRWLNEGERIPASGGGSNYFGYDDYEPASFAITKKIPTILVTYWPNQRPVFVPIDGYEFKTDETYLEPIYSSSGYGSGSYRTYMINQTRNMINMGDGKLFPRDSKGRFIKEVKNASK